MKKITALLYIFIFIFTSCKEEVEYEDLGVKNIIVINGRFIDGETPWCQVSRSDIIFDQIKNKITPTVFLPDAKVTASDDNSDYKYVVVADSAMMEAKGLTAKAGETYTLKAKSTPQSPYLTNPKLISEWSAWKRSQNLTTIMDHTK